MIDLGALAGFAMTGIEWVSDNSVRFTQAGSMLGGAAGAWSWWHARRKERRATWPYVRLVAHLDPTRDNVMQVWIRVRNRSDDHLVLHDLRLQAIQDQPIKIRLTTTPIRAASDST